MFACEPNPETYRVLLANALANRAANFFPVGCALGETAGTATLFLNDDDEGMSSLVVAADRSTTVTVATLDELHALLGFARVRMVKIDVEGFEQQVIAGGAAFLRDARPESVVFEINQMLPGVDQDADLAIRRHLAGLGYDCYLIRPWLNVPDHPPFPGDGLWARLDPDRPLLLVVRQCPGDAPQHRGAAVVPAVSYCATQPPSIDSGTPVMVSAAGEHRNTASPPICSGVENRVIGCFSRTGTLAPPARRRCPRPWRAPRAAAAPAGSAPSPGRSRWR